MHPPDPYLLDVLAALFPGRGAARTVVRAGSPPPGTRHWWVLPSPGRARVLVPVGPPQAAALLTRHGRGVRGRARAVAAAAVRARLAPALPWPRVALPAGAPGPLEDLLQEVLGGPLALGVLLGPPRPNRKPVLQVFDARGRVVGFVKVGTTAATGDLVRGEASRLARVHAAGLRLVQAPPVLAATAVGGLQVLVLAPLGSSQRPGRPTRPAPPLAAMAEVAGSQGTTVQPLTGGAFWAATTRAVRAAPDGPVRRRLAQLHERLARHHGGTELVMGAWHGDWAPWNMGLHGDRVQLWDWERFGADVPWGFDLVHFLAQRVDHRSSRRAAQEVALQTDLAAALALDVTLARPQPAQVLLPAYLLRIALRFAADGPPAGHPRARWAADLATRLLDDAPGSR